MADAFMMFPALDDSSSSSISFPPILSATRLQPPTTFPALDDVSAEKKVVIPPPALPALSAPSTAPLSEVVSTPVTLPPIRAPPTFPFQSKVDTSMLKPYQIVRFENDKVIVDFPEFSLQELDKSYTVISIIGQARKGKSTFLNTMLSYLTGSDVHAFKTSDGIETCTRGIHMLMYDQFIFLDCHGLGDATSGSDARHDPALLLLVYSLSNLIIHNVQSMNNFTLKELEALTVFLSEYETPRDKFNVPHLVFRVRDYDLLGSLEELARVTLQGSGDQFDGLKNTIVANFASINAYSTTVTADDMSSIREGRFMTLLDTDRNQFKSTVSKIVATARSANTFLTVFKSTLDTMASKINENKINVDVLDVTEIYQQNIIIKYIDKQRTEMRHLWYPFSQTKLETEHTDALTTRHRDIQSFMDKFVSMFPKFDHSLIESYVSKLQSEFDSVILESEQYNANLVSQDFQRLTAEMDQYFISNMDKIRTLSDFVDISTLLTNMTDYVAKYSATFIRKYAEPLVEHYMEDIAELQKTLTCNKTVLELIHDQTKALAEEIDEMPECAAFIGTIDVDPFKTFVEQVAKPFVTIAQKVIDDFSKKQKDTEAVVEIKTLAKYTSYNSPVGFASERRMILLSEVLQMLKTFETAKTEYYRIKTENIRGYLAKLTANPSKPELNKFFAANPEMAFVHFAETDARIAGYNYLIQQIGQKTQSPRVCGVYFKTEIVSALQSLFPSLNAEMMLNDLANKEKNVYTITNPSYTDVVRANIISYLTTAVVMQKYVGTS
jgi:hypothetical protein